jgi:hypothetical protein
VRSISAMCLAFPCSTWSQAICTKSACCHSDNCEHLTLRTIGRSPAYKPHLKIPPAAVRLGIAEKSLTMCPRSHCRRLKTLRRVLSSSRRPVIYRTRYRRKSSFKLTAGPWQQLSGSRRLDGIWLWVIAASSSSRGTDAARLMIVSPAQRQLHRCPANKTLRALID